MKKILTGMLIAAMVLAVTGCGQTAEKKEEAQFASAKEYLDAVYESYDEDHKFPIIGGDSENMKEQEAGAFDVAKTEEMEMSLGFPADASEDLDDAASMIHMMNANTFTGAAFHLKDGADFSKTAEAVKETVLSKQWLCGMPDTLLIIDAGYGYMLIAFGEAEMVELFKTTALSVIGGSEVTAEEPIVDNF